MHKNKLIKTGLHWLVCVVVVLAAGFVFFLLNLLLWGWAVSPLWQLFGGVADIILQQLLMKMAFILIYAALAFAIFWLGKKYFATQVKRVAVLFAAGWAVAMVFLLLELSLGQMMLVNNIKQQQAYRQISQVAPLMRDEKAFLTANVSFNIEGKAYWLPKDFTSALINIKEGIRRTIGQPDEYKRTLYMLGGSTLINLRVSDEAHIASRIQLMLNEWHPNIWRVVNLGVSGYTTHEQLLRLQEIALQPGDWVIFYDGVNDAPRYASEFDMLTLPDWQKAALGVEEGAAVKLFLWESLGIAPLLQRTNLANAWRNWRMIQQQEQALQDPQRVGDLLDWLHIGYQQNIESAQAYTQANQAHFIHFLQPNLFTLDQLSPYEQALSGEMGAGNFVPLAYAEFLKIEHEFAEKDILSVDLTHVLDHANRTTDEEIFFDWIHVNEVGDAMIAQAMFEVLQPLLIGQLEE